MPLRVGPEQLRELFAAGEKGTFSSRSAYLSTGSETAPVLPPDAAEVAVPRRPRWAGLCWPDDPPLFPPPRAW